jgi:hypothetical protein
MSLPFTHAVLDDDGEVVRKYRWSRKEAKWFTENNKDVIVVELPKEKVKPFNTDDYEPCLF